MPQKKACIIGAGPAGLTAALELLKHTDVKPVIFEMDQTVGGLSQTVNYHGNRIDIGGHRFFSKSDRVMQAWRDILPQEGQELKAENTDKIMLVRERLSRILFLRKFFAYPLALNLDTLKKLGLTRVMMIGLSYIGAQIRPVKPEKTLEDFFINRFGRELYRTFFEDYTEKVWGVPCCDIPRDWGAQRVKGLSVGKAVWHAVKKQFTFQESLAQKQTETSLIERFLYPKYGPGQLWEEVAADIKDRGGKILLGHKITGIECSGKHIQNITVLNEEIGDSSQIALDYLLSSMPVKDLINALTGDETPPLVKLVANDLMYRDFITIGVMLPQAKYQVPPDNWIYVQEKDVKVGRIQIFNNWSPYMVKEQHVLWLGLEYFCNEGDDLWNEPDSSLQALAANELRKIGFIDDCRDVLDSIVIRMPKAYPAYFGSYKQFGVIREYIDQIGNLFLIGRNGMHRYNNMDHSMLTAMAAVENIAAGIVTKGNLWSINAEEEYHEQK